MCQKVLEFDAASVPHAARSRRSLERYVLGATGFRGRSLAAGSGSSGDSALHEAAGPQAKQVLQQEPVRIEELGADEEEQGGAAGGGGKALLPTKSGAAAGPVLVSVLLPANASGSGGSAKLAAVDKVFVVLLHPQERYVTYSCMLPRPVVL
jgi:hypothetical protein